MDLDQWKNFYHDMWVVHHNAMLKMKEVFEELERDSEKVRKDFNIGESKEIELDKNGHDWVDRGKNVCPFVCTRCGALSGTDKAQTKCDGKHTADKS